MSIIIKGMDMPKKDTGCRIIILYNGQVAMDNGTFIPEYQAIEIPTPHGEIIDRDRIKGIIGHSNGDYEIVYKGKVLLEAEK